MKNYLKDDIIHYLAGKTGYTLRICEEVLAAYHDLMVETIRRGDRIRDYGYLDLGVKFVPGHEKMDPRDHTKSIWVEDKYKVVMGAGKALRDAARAKNNNG